MAALDLTHEGAVDACLQREAFLRQSLPLPCSADALAQNPKCALELHQLKACSQCWVYDHGI